MAKVPLRSGLLADVSNSESEQAMMKSLLSKCHGVNDADKMSSISTEDGAAFSPRTDLANKLSHTSLICDDQIELDLSNSPPLATPNRRADTKRNVVSLNVGRMSPLVIADEQTKFPELDDANVQRSVDMAWGRRRSSTFTELSLDSGFGSSSMQSWSDSQRSGASPTTTRPLAAISESSNFAFSPSAFTSPLQDASRDSFKAENSCPSTPQSRVIAVRSKNRNSPKQHFSPSPSLPQHIQALVRGGFSAASSSTSPQSTGVARKPLGKQSLFATAIANSNSLPRANSLKRVATSDCMDSSSLPSSQERPSAHQRQPFSPFGEAKKMKSQLESIHEGLEAKPRHSLTHSQSSSILNTPLHESQNAAVTVTKTATPASEGQQAPPDTSMIGDGSRPYLLPCKPHESTVLIEPTTLAGLLAGKYSSKIKRFHIIDCRYPYEHAGGHIKGAVNHPKAEPLLKEFFDDIDANAAVEVDENGEQKRTLLIFHCEFSSKRAPDMVKAFRKCDRHRNRNNYPHLDYPEVYMLKGGYKAFYEYCCSTNQCELLEPHGGYTPMHAEEHNTELRRWKKYKTMSAVEDRLAKAVGQSAISPLSATCTGNDDRLAFSQQEPPQNRNSIAIDENNRQYRVARRNPSIRRQLSSFSVPHNNQSDSASSPVFKRCLSSRLAEKNTPLGSSMLMNSDDQENSENRPPMSSPTHW